MAVDPPPPGDVNVNVGVVANPEPLLIMSILVTTPTVTTGARHGPVVGLPVLGYDTDGKSWNTT